MARVVRLSVTRFRGISKTLDISFVDRDGSTTSLLIVGDNGSGKSSIADALEFCMRGKVSRRGNAGFKRRREAKNFLHVGAPVVRVALDDDREYIRGGHDANLGTTIRLTQNQYLPGFNLAPVLLSRADIDTFWQVEPDERMRFFFDYMRVEAKHAGYIALEVERAEADLKSADFLVLKKRVALADFLKIPVFEIPDRRGEFSYWRRNNFSGPVRFYQPSESSANQPSKRRRRRGDIVILLDGVHEALELAHQRSQHLEGKRLQLGTEADAPPIISRDLPGILSEISEQVSEDFINIAGLTHVQGVRIVSEDNGYKLHVLCRLSNGDEIDPTQVLSEGSLDLLALLILLGVAKACAERGQERFLVLDDVWQSVDNIHRLAVLRFIFSERFRGWQFLITVHDRLWARLVENAARKHKSTLRTIQLLDWDSQDGARLRGGTLASASALAGMIESSPPEILAAFAGRALEELSDELSLSLQTSVTRAPGDRYTLEALLPGVLKVLKKAPVRDEAKEAAAAINDIYALRNLYGAHYSESAQSLSVAESREFARAVVALSAATHCSECGQPLGLVSSGNVKRIDWTCGHLDGAHSGSGTNDVGTRDAALQVVNRQANPPAARDKLSTARDGQSRLIVE